jgi:hypothetical protein
MKNLTQRIRKLEESRNTAEEHHEEGEKLEALLRGYAEARVKRVKWLGEVSKEDLEAELIALEMRRTDPEYLERFKPEYNEGWDLRVLSDFNVDSDVREVERELEAIANHWPRISELEKCGSGRDE